MAAAKGIWTEISAGYYDFVPTFPSGTTLAYGGINSGGGLLSLSPDFTNGPQILRFRTATAYFAQHDNLKGITDQKKSRPRRP